MSVVIEIITPVLILTMLGFGAVKLGLFPKQAADGLAKFVFDFAVPILLIRTFATTDLPEHFPWQLFLSFYLPAALIYFIGFIVGRYVFKQNYMDQILNGFSWSFGNNVLIGLPVVILTFGEKGTLPFLILLSIHGLLYFTFSSIFLEIGRQSGTRFSLREMLKGLITNPVIFGISVGLTLNFLNIPIPTFIDVVASHMQAAVTPCALFSLGVALTNYGVFGKASETITTVVFKNILFPVLVWIVSVSVFKLPILWAMVTTLMAAQPTGINVYLLASRYKHGQSAVASNIFVSTSFALFSLAFFLYWFQKQGYLNG